MGSNQSINGPNQNTPNQEHTTPKPQQNPHSSKGRFIKLDSNIMSDATRMFENTDSDPNLMEEIKEFSSAKKKKKEVNDIVHALFSWTHGGNEVFLAGNFTNWDQGKLQMEKKGKDFHLKLPLKKGAYEFKFIVDGKWCFDPDQPKREDCHKNINNVIDISDTASTAPSTTEEEENQNEESSYNQYIPEDQEVDQIMPPELPVHLSKNLLNVKLHSFNTNIYHNIHDEYENTSYKPLNPPTHVTLGHVSFMSEPIISSINIVSATERFKNKFVTTLYFRKARRSEEDDEIDCL